MSVALHISKEDIADPGKRENFTVGVVECGRIGLATSCLLAEAGFRVICVAKDQRFVDFARRRRFLFHEPRLAKLANKHLETNRITVTTKVKDAASASDIIIFVVPASIDRNEDPDYSYVEKICREVGMGIRQGCLIIFQSTVAPGATGTTVKQIIENASGLKAGIDFDLAYSPIRANPGQVLQDISTKPRIVGAINDHSLNSASLFLSTITKGNIVTVANMKTAEAASMFEKAHTNINIALANEFSQFCEKIGIDFFEAQRAANMYSCCHLTLPKISNKHSRSSILLLEEAEAIRTKLRMLSLATKINDGMLTYTLRNVKQALRSCGKTLRRARIAVFGVSSHPNMKEHPGSSTRKLVDMLKKRGATVQVYDPFFSQKELSQMRYVAKRTLTKSVEGVDCFLITVKHNQFRRLNLRRMKIFARKPAAIVDMARVIDPKKAEREGFVYRGIGRGV